MRSRRLGNLRLKHKTRFEQTNKKHESQETTSSSKRRDSHSHTTRNADRNSRFGRDEEENWPRRTVWSSSSYRASRVGWQNTRVGIKWIWLGKRDFLNRVYRENLGRVSSWYPSEISWCLGLFSRPVGCFPCWLGCLLLLGWWLLVGFWRESEKRTKYENDGGGWTGLETKMVMTLGENMKFWLFSRKVAQINSCTSNGSVQWLYISYK